MTEPGAWTCPSCSYQNYASRDQCFNRSCRQSRPEGSSVSKSASSNKRKRHDPATSKQLVWSQQADAKTLTKNQELRERYRATNGEGMSQEDAERAKILITRDERKRQKKKEKSTSEDGPEAKNAKSGHDDVPADDEEMVVDKALSTPPSKDVATSNRTTKDKDAKGKAKSQKDKNKVLLERFQKSKGKGMKEEEVERAKQLLARAERKNAKRARVQGSSTQSNEVKAQ